MRTCTETIDREKRLYNCIGGLRPTRLHRWFREHQLNLTNPFGEKRLYRCL
jgi:hypothetical protein